MGASDRTAEDAGGERRRIVLAPAAPIRLGPITIEPALRRIIHDDGRDLCAEMGLCDYWLNTDRWPDRAEAVTPHYDFKAQARRPVPSPDR